ncbi:hypothetical protein HAX54_037669 [Datura stramonium]|uniref:Uncharacterized protein n=1 Tax=Datura stramonium TaxID=4076 RepID=A0ABS8VMK8_DATST|nr:hypothetical protein [Datura stramonium]
MEMYRRLLAEQVRGRKEKHGAVVVQFHKLLFLLHSGRSLAGRTQEGSRVTLHCLVKKTKKQRFGVSWRCGRAIHCYSPKALTAMRRRRWRYGGCMLNLESREMET